VTTLAGLGHSLWIFGLLQVFSNLGYYLLARAGGPNLPLMYAATSFELLTSGLGTGAFSVLLLRMTQKRFSATQYALFSSLFALPRLLAGPVTGFVVDAIGWQAFFLTTIALGVPGLVMLARFVPIGVREPQFTVEEPRAARPLTTPGLVVRGAAGAVLAGTCAFVLVALLAALKTMRESAGAGFDFATAARLVAAPASITDWVQLFGILAFAAIGGCSPRRSRPLAAAPSPPTCPTGPDAPRRASRAAAGSRGDAGEWRPASGRTPRPACRSPIPRAAAPGRGRTR